MNNCDEDPLAMEATQEGNEEVMNTNLENHIITPLQPVVIEDLSDTVIHTMTVDMSEFQETQPMQIEQINTLDTTNDNVNIDYHQSNDNDGQNLEIRDVYEVDLTDQFLRGKISFTEYSSTLDNDGDYEFPETESTRNDFSDRTRNRVKPSVPRKKKILPLALQGLMGEANVRFAKGQLDLAAKMCFEIIRQVPNAPEPFQTLAMIYEHDQPEKSLQFALIAAHLNPKDADQWVHLANLSLMLESKNIKQAITCYTKAIVASPKDISLYEARAELQEKIGDKKSTFRGFVRLINVLGPEDAPTIMKYAKILTKQFIMENNYEQALYAMENVFNKCSNLVEPSDVNIMVDILISLKQFHRCLEILSQYTDIWIIYNTISVSGTEVITPAEIKQETMHSGIIESCGIPDNVPVDLKAKCLVALIELNEILIAQTLLPNLYQNENPEVSGDLYLDIAEALMSKKQFRLALDLLEPLVHSVNYSLAAVWLRYAECWLGCGDISKAISSYEVVRQLSPRHMEARLDLARLYEEQGLINEAIDILYQEPELVELFDAKVMLKRTQMLYNSRRYDEYFASAMTLFSRHCIVVKSKAEITTLTRATCLRIRLECLQKHRLSRGESFNNESALKFKDTDTPSFDDEFNLFLQVCNTAYRLKRYGLLQKFCFTALTSKLFDCKSAYIMFLCLTSCIYTNDAYHGFNIVRELVRSDVKYHYWNLLNVIIQRAEDSRHNRFVMRLLTREDVFSHLHILHANNCLVAGTYKYALNDYISLFKAVPSPLLAFLISVTQLQMACQKYASRKNQIVVQAIAFLQKYAQSRGKGSEQEVAYNMGRTFHQLGLIPAAVHYYKQVLDAPTPKLVQDNHELLDLKREAAFNLHLIYLQSDNRHFAAMYLQKYIIV